MRLFIAVPIPKKVKQELLALRSPVEGMRWQDPEQMHLTLKFLGEKNKSFTKKLQKRLATIAHPSFTLSIDGIGSFPEGKSPKVVWAGISKNELLVQLQKKVEVCCQEMGIAPEKRAYKPHITLTRVKGSAKQEVESFINQNKEFNMADIPVNEFVLYESKLDAEGAQHHRLQTFHLLENG